MTEQEKYIDLESALSAIERIAICVNGAFDALTKGKTDRAEMILDIAALVITDARQKMNGNAGTPAAD